MPYKKGTKTNKRETPATKQAAKPAPKKRSEGTFEKVGALWLGETRQGKKFMSGRMTINDEEIRIMVFKNDYKELAKHPDYIIQMVVEANQNSGPITDDDVPF